MRKYRVAVTEIYRKVVSVPARNEREAHQRAWDMWNNTEILLDFEDFDGAEMHVLSQEENIAWQKDITLRTGATYRKSR